MEKSVEMIVNEQLMVNKYNKMHLTRHVSYQPERKKTTAVTDTTFTVIKRKPEKNRACIGLEPHDPLQHPCSAPWSSFFLVHISAVQTYDIHIYNYSLFHI